MPNENNNDIQVLSAQLKTIYLDKRFITLPLKHQPSDKRAHPIEEAINMAFLDSPDGQAESPDDINGSEKHHHKKEITLSHLIDYFAESDGEEKSMLMTGSVGVGKSTLCHLLAHAWANGFILKNIPAIIWIPLQSIRSFQQNISIEEFIWRTCFHSESNIKKTVKTLFSTGAYKQCLFILDGYNDVDDLTSHYPMLLKLLRLNAHKLVTTRPHANPNHTHAIQFKRHLRHIGFQEEHIHQYITYYFRNQENKKITLLEYIEKNPSIRTTCHTPINLFTLCRRWSGKNYHGHPTYRDLYKRFVQTLLRHAKIRTDDEQERYIDAISHIAHEHSIGSSRLHIKKSRIKNTLKKHHAGITLKDILNTGLIEPLLTHQGPNEQTEFHCFFFINRTIQEYFSARHFKKIIVSGEIEEKTRTLRYISRNKYNPTFRRTLLFITAMVCKQNGNQAAMDSLWDAIIIHDLDIVGLKHQELMVLALEASSDGRGLPKETVNKIKGDILAWILFYSKQKNDDDAPSVKNSLKDKAEALFARTLIDAPMVTNELQNAFARMRLNTHAMRHHSPHKPNKKTKQPPSMASLRYITKNFRNCSAEDFHLNLERLCQSLIPKAARQFSYRWNTLDSNSNPAYYSHEDFDIELLSELLIHNKNIVQLANNKSWLNINFYGFFSAIFKNIFLKWDDAYFSDKQIINITNAFLRLAENKEVRPFISPFAEGLAGQTSLRIPRKRLALFIEVITLLRPLINPQIFSSMLDKQNFIKKFITPNSITTDTCEIKVENENDHRLVFMWTELCKTQGGPPELMSIFLKKRIQTKNISLKDKRELIDKIEEIILPFNNPKVAPQDNPHITSNLRFLSVFVAISGELDKDTRLSCIIALINTLAFKTTEKWIGQLNAIWKIAKSLTSQAENDFAEQDKFDIINQLVTIASASKNNIIENMDRYDDLVTTAKALFTLLSQETQGQIYGIYQCMLQQLDDPGSLSIITLLTSPGEIPFAFRVKLTQLLHNPQPFIVSRATALLMRTTAKTPDLPDKNIPDEEILFYLYLELSYGNKEEVEHNKQQYRRWLLLNPKKWLLALLKVGFSNKELLLAFIDIVNELEISMDILLSAYVDFLDSLSGVDTETLLNEKTYLFCFIWRALQLNGFTLRMSPTLGTLVFYDHTGMIPYQFNRSKMPPQGIINRERAIILAILNNIYNSLKNDELPSSLIGSLVHFEQPPFEQRSSVNFYDEGELKCWADVFMFSPYVIKNSPRSAGETLPAADHLIPYNQFIEVDHPNRYVRLSAPYDRDDILKIEIKNSFFLHYAFIKDILDIKNILGKITYLDLSRNQLEDRHLNALYDNGFLTPTIRVLKLSHNNLTEHSLCKLLQQLNGLRYLFIDNNKICFDESDMNKIKTTLQNNSSLVYLDVSNNFLPAYTMELTPNPRRVGTVFARPLEYRPNNHDITQPDTNSPPIEPIFSLKGSTLFSAYNGKPIQSILDPKSPIDEENAVICVITKKGKKGPESLNLIASEHMYLLIEDLHKETGQRRLLRADLFTPDKKNVVFVLAQISLHELKVSEALEQNVYPYRVRPDGVEKIIAKILEDQRNQQGFQYAMIFDGNKQTLNCSKWVIESLLAEIDIHITRTSILPSHQLTKSSPCTIM